MTRRLAGAVLAGGQSRRFGRDKARAIYRGRPLIDWSIAALAAHVELLLVSGGDYPPHESVPDVPEPGLGPLGGLAGALRVAAARGHTHLLTAPCDTPHIPEALLASLVQRETAAYAAHCPVIGIWPTSLAPGLAAYLQSGAPRAVKRWAEHIGAGPLGDDMPVPNINDEAALIDLARGHGGPAAGQTADAP